MITARHLKVLAFVVADELARRRRLGIPIPQSLRAVELVLSSELAARGHEHGGRAAAPPTIETTAQRAHRLGVSKRTVRRYAAESGATRTGNAWIFPA